MRLPQELELTGQQPNIALAVFFVPYIVFEIPSNILMKRFTPHVWLSLCILGFGVVELAQGFVRSYSGLLATRFFLGLFEAGIFPGSFYLISFWYKRQQSQKRFTLYFCSVIVASAFGGLLASAIAEMDGVRGLSNWRWIFILEGIFTILTAIAAFFFVSDFPSGAKWLPEKEKQFVMRETSEDVATVSDGTVMTRRDFTEFAKDPKNCLGALMYFCKSYPVFLIKLNHASWVRHTGLSLTSCCCSGLCFCILYSNHRQDTRVLNGTDSATFSTAICSRPRDVSRFSLPLGSYGQSTTIRSILWLSRHRRLSDIDVCTRGFLCAVCRGMLSMYGGIQCRSNRHMLVSHEPPRS